MIPRRRHPTNGILIQLCEFECLGQQPRAHTANIIIFLSHIKANITYFNILCRTRLSIRNISTTIPLILPNEPPFLSVSLSRFHYQYDSNLPFPCQLFVGNVKTKIVLVARHLLIVPSFILNTVTYFVFKQNLLLKSFVRIFYDTTLL